MPTDTYRYLQIHSMNAYPGWLGFSGILLLGRCCYRIYIEEATCGSVAFVLLVAVKEQPMYVNRRSEMVGNDATQI